MLFPVGTDIKPCAHHAVCPVRRGQRKTNKERTAKRRKGKNYEIR